MIIKKYSYCILCKISLDDTNNSSEHLILNAIGGRKKIRGVMCIKCNNQKGSTWDSTLAQQLNPWNLIFQISRGIGKSPAKIFDTINGEKIRLHHDGRTTLPRSSIEEIDNEQGKSIKIKASSMSEVNQIVKGFMRKYPNISSDRFSFNIESSFLKDPLILNAVFGENDAIKSLIKSAVVFAVDNKIDPEICKNAIEYLRTENAKICFGFFYDRDLILNRPTDKIFHCVAVSNHNENNLLLGYIEFFSIFRIIICLSDLCCGEKIHEIYAIDPILGEEIDLNFEIPIEKKDLELLYRGEKICHEYMRKAFDIPLKIAVQNNRNNLMKKIIDDAISYGFENCGAKESEMLNEEHVKKIVNHIMVKLRPFIKK